MVSKVLNIFNRSKDNQSAPNDSLELATQRQLIWATNALTSIGPTVGKERTTPTIILPEIR